MDYKILNTNTDESLLERLLTIRDVRDNHTDFFDPTYDTYWQDFKDFPGSKAGIERLYTAISNNEKIIIFGDYDVDGIMATFVMYTFLRKYIGYDNVSLRLPHRVRDGYGIKKHHIDEIHEAGSDLIITVDNGITSAQEVKHAKTLGIDTIITDHHQPVGDLPDCTALINPHLSETLRFKEMCGATVALKFALGYAKTYGKKHNINNAGKKQLLQEFLPFVAIASIADCMPLVDENRLIVKKGLDLINKQRNSLQKGLRLFLDHCNIDIIDTYHVGFVLGPRLNATGRMGDALDGLKCFLLNNTSQIKKQFALLEELNTKRKQTQKTMLKRTKELIDPDDAIMIAADPSFHEGIVGIVAGRVCQQYNKPAMILSIDHEKNQATGSLRGPHYFSIIDMLKSADEYLTRYGGHEQAGGVTVPLDKLEAFCKHCNDYCSETIPQQPPTKPVLIDTPIYNHELKDEIIMQLAKLGPFGEGNHEPILLIEQVTIREKFTIGKKSGHLKLIAQKETLSFAIMRWRKAESIDTIPTTSPISIIGTIKKDTYNGGFFIDAKEIITEGKSITESIAGEREA